MKFYTLSALLASASAVTVQRGDSFPAPILPGSEPIMPIPSDPILLQQHAETRQEAHIRHKLQHKLRKALRKSHFPSEENLVFLGDDDTVEDARLQAA
jgi:hypothetical protein